MIVIDKSFIERILIDASKNPRLRQNFDLRTSENDASQRMLNALMPDTEVAIHRHPQSSENIIVLLGSLDVVLFDHEGNEIERISLCPTDGTYGCVVPAGTWHTVDVHEPSVIYEGKDGRYGEDGSELL